MIGARPPGRIITFYSYKGGTGRSMAMANMAWLLALAGHKVLAIDWDLEAPGLHRYFHPFLSDPELTSSDGVIDFVQRFIEEASARSVAADEAPLAPELADGSHGGRTDVSRRPVSKASNERAPDSFAVDEPADWFVPFANISHYANSVDYAFPGEGILDFIPAGRQGPHYAGRVNSFNWKHFYEKLGGWSVIEEMRRQLRQVYEFILVDSRTGVADTAGICTVQVPDDVVVCFTLNYQSVHGASSAARSILDQRKEPIRIFPVPMRVEFQSEKLKRDAVDTYAQSLFLGLMNARDMPTGAAREKYWGEVEVPYIGFYAFEEHLAWFTDPPNQVTGVLASIKRLTAYMATPKALELPGPDPAERNEVLTQFGAVWANRAPAPGVDARPKSVVYVSSNELDRDEAQRFTTAARNEAGELLLSGSMTRQDDWTAAFIGILQRARAMIVLVGAHGLSPLQQRELAVASAFRASNTTSGLRIIAITLPGGPRQNLPVFADAVVHGARPETLDEVLSAPNATDDDKQDAVPPYPGLRPFRVEEGDVFCGRELHVSGIVEEVRRTKFIVLGGAAKSGRTSLVRSGVAWKLLAQIASGSTWKIAMFSAEGDPIQGLAEALIAARQTALSDGQRVAAVAELAGLLRHGGATALKDAIGATLSAWPRADQMLIVVDDAHDAEGAVVRLLRVVLTDAPATLLIVTDVGLLPPMTTEEMRQAIEGPARRAGLQVEAALVDTLLRDLTAAPLPLLQFCLARLWERRQDRTLTLAAYEEIGRAQAAVEVWAEERLRAASSSAGSIPERLLLRFVTFPHSGVPRLQALEVSGLGLDPTLTLSQLSALQQAGLVVHEESARGEFNQYRLLHPILLQHWPRLAELTREEAMAIHARGVARAKDGFADADPTLPSRSVAIGAPRAAGAASLTVRGRSRWTLIVVGLIVLAFAAIAYYSLKAPTGRGGVALQKLKGDNQTITLTQFSSFVIKAVDGSGAPVRGLKIAWQTPACGPRLYIDETTEDGTSSATNMCSVLQPGRYEQTATPVATDLDKGFTDSGRLAPQGDAVTFSFDLK
jgi:hypothetical protein